MQPHPPRHHAPRARTVSRRLPAQGRLWRVWAWLLLCMVLAQTLGLMHGVAHGTHAHAQRGLVPLQVDGVSPARVVLPAHAAWVADVFGAHHDGSDCRLYDQSSHGDCITSVAPLWLPPQTFLALLPPLVAAPLRAAAAFFQARAPPSFR